LAGFEVSLIGRFSGVPRGEASAVVRMFQWASQGITPSVIASYANALGWITGGGKF